MFLADMSDERPTTKGNINHPASRQSTLGRTAVALKSLTTTMLSRAKVNHTQFIMLARMAMLN